MAMHESRARQHLDSDEQELQTFYTMAWPPAILSAIFVYGRQ